MLNLSKLLMLLSGKPLYRGDPEEIDNPPENTMRTAVPVSIIIPCRNEGKNLLNTLKSIYSCPTALPFEIIVVDDGSEDGCCDFLRKSRNPFMKYNIRLVTTFDQGAANARNLGATQALGEMLVFCDAHVTVEPGWLESLAEAITQPGVDAATPAIISMEDPRRSGYGVTWDQNLEITWLPKTEELTPIPIAPLGCLAVKASSFQAVDGFEKGFRTWGFEDAEFSLKLWLMGYGVYVNPAAKINHLFRQDHPYPVQPEDIYYNMLRMTLTHFNEERIARVIDLVKPHSFFNGIMARLLTGGTLEQRQRFLGQRLYDDNWFMERFNIPF